MLTGAVRSMIFPGCPVALPRPGLTLAGGGEVVAYTTADGLELRGLWSPAAKPRGVAVYFHGNAESVAVNLEIASAFTGQGLSVLLAEFRGYGGCPGSPSADGLTIDGRAAVAEAARRGGVDPKEVVLIGRSVGSGVATALAAEGLGRSVVLLSPYTSIMDMAGLIAPRVLAQLLVRDRFDNVASLAAATQPVLVIHGTADEVIPFAQGERLAKSLGERCRFVPLDGVGHNDLFLRSGARIVRETLAHVGAETVDDPKPAGPGRSSN